MLLCYVRYVCGGMCLFGSWLCVCGGVLNMILLIGRLGSVVLWELRFSVIVSVLLLLRC